MKIFPLSLQTSVYFSCAKVRAIRRRESIEISGMQNGSAVTWISQMALYVKVKACNMLRNEIVRDNFGYYLDLFDRLYTGWYFVVNLRCKSGRVKARLRSTSILKLQ